MLDSSGSPQPGFILGHNFWLGSIKGCDAVRQPHTITISDRYPRNMHEDLLRAKAPFDTNYRVVYAAHTSPWQIQVEFVLSQQVHTHTQHIHIKCCNFSKTLRYLTVIITSYRECCTSDSVCPLHVPTMKSLILRKSTSIDRNCKSNGYSNINRMCWK